MLSMNSIEERTATNFVQSVQLNFLRKQFAEKNKVTMPNRLQKFFHHVIGLGSFHAQPNLFIAQCYITAADVPFEYHRK